MKDLREGVRRRYGTIAERGISCCGPSSGTATSCCGGADTAGAANGYSPGELEQVPDGANLGLGCGNPTALGSLQAGETVLDLGSGAGFDCFLAARKVGERGRVIGVDMTPSMLERARANALKGGYSNVEFVEGYIESLPVEDSSVDVVISNCVINLSVDKPQVFREIARVLKPGGRMYVSDLVLTRRLPAVLRRSMTLYSACVAGALTKQDYLRAIEEAGLQQIQVLSERVYSAELLLSDPTTARIAHISRLFPPLRGWVESVVSVSVVAHGGALTDS